MADLFGFEELTNEVSERSNLQDSQPSVSQGVEEKKIFQQRILSIDASACSENQVIVPILDLTGVKKYKVLARQPVDDGPSANSSQSGASGNVNSTTSVSQQDSDLQKEQRKENILVTTECNHKNAVKKKLHTHKELNAPIKKSLTSKKHGTNIFKRKWLVKNKMNELKSKSKINRKLWKDKAVEYEFHSDSETKCDMATMNTGRSQSLDNRLISNEDNCRIEVTETALSSSLKPKQCIVKLRRSSSLDILSRKKVCDLKLEGVPCENVMTEKTVHELSMVENNVEKLRRADNSDALKQKQMVYDTDIDVRKSGRLKSAKCASRYRGDYGIRAQTYTKLISQKVKESIDSESDNVSGCNSFNEHAMIKSKSSSVLSRLSDSGKTAQRNPESGSNGKLFKATKAMKKHWSFSKTVPNVQEDNVKDVNSLCTTNFEESAHKLSSSEIFSLSEVPLNNPVICDKNVVIDGLPQACNKANLSGVESMLSIGCKLCCNCCHADNCDNSSRHTCAATKYVHAIGKSVHKKENQKVHVRKVSMPMELDLSCYEGSPEKTDMDRMEGLAKLRQKLFEKAGANVEEADKTSKTFECALISSKRKEQQVTAEMIAIDSAYEQKFRTSGGCSEESEWFSNPKADLVGKEILEEVSKTLENLPKIKIGSKINQKNDLKDLVMCKRVDNLVKDHTKSFVNCSLESYDDSEEVKEDKLCDTNIKPSTRKKSQPHQKTAKCHVCDQTFKNRDLLRKHYPCRVRQTRTWVQNKLRPHRAVKRTEPAPKKFVCQLPKSGKEKSRPMLLTYRKTKFRKVKGKRRRKLYHVIQDLIQKRKAQTWPHLNVVFDDLSFKEQCMYKVGLICVGDAFQGLDNYAAEEINLFEEHRALERLVNNVSMPADIDCSIERVSYLESSAIQECETCITKQSETGTIQVFETSSQHELKTNIPQGLETSQILESEKSTTKETEFITTQESETSLTHELETSLNPDFKFGTNQEPETSTNKGSKLESSIPLSADQKKTFEEQYIATKTVNGIDTQMFSQSENKQELVSSILSEIKETNVVDGSESRVKNDVEVIVEDNLNGTTEMMATNEEIINSLCACDTICKGAIHSENKPDGFLFRYVPPLTVEHTETIDIVHDSCPDSNVGYTNVEENQASTDLNKREDDMQKSHTCEADLQMTSDGHESFYFTQCDEQIVECVVDEVHIAECVVDEVLCEETSEKSYTYQDKINKNSLLEDNICQTVASNETIHATCQENSEQLSHLLEKTEKTLVQDSTKEIKIFISKENGGDDVIDDVIEPKKDNMHVKGNDVVVDVEQHNTLDDLMAILDCDGMEDGLKTTFESYGEASCLKSSYINGDSSNSSSEPTQNTQHRNIGMQHEDVGFVYCESQDRGFKNMIDDASKSSALITAYDEIANETAIKASGLKITNTISVEEMPNMEIKEDSIYSSSDANSSTSVHSTVHGSNMLSEKSHNSLKNAAPFCCADDNVKGITPYAMASIPECSQDMNSVEEALAYNGNAEIGHTLENIAVNTEFREDWIPLAPEDVLKNVWKMGVEKETYETKQSESSELCSLTNSNQFRLINESPNANIYNVEKCDTKASQIPRLNPDILQTVGLPPLKIPKKNNTSAKSSYNTGFKNAVTECNKLKKYKFEIKQVIVGTEMKNSRKMGEIKPKRHRNTRESEACEKMMIQNATESGLLKRNTLNEEAVKESNTLQNFSSSLSHTECILHKNSSISTSMSKALTETHKIKNIQTFISEEPCVASNNITNSGDERTKKAKHISLEEYMKKKGLTYHPVKPKMSEDTENTNEIKVDLVSRNEKVANEGDLHCNIVFSNEKESHSDVCKDTCEESEGLLMEGSRHELKSDHLDKDVVKQLNLYNVEDTQQFNCDEYDPESNFLLDTDGMTDDSDHSHSPDNNEAHKDACFVKNLLLAVSLIHDIVEDQREYCSANGIEIQNCNSEQGYRRQLQHSSLDQRSDSLHSDIEDSNSSSQGEEAEKFSYTETLKNTYSPAATVTNCDQMEIEESGIREHQTRNEDNSEYVSKANGEFYVVEEHSTRVLSTDCKTKNSLNQSDVESHSLQEECSEPVDCIETTAEEKDFTVKYEMNGLFIKENVLTGDKNLIESLSISSSSPQSQILMETLDTNMLDDTETWSKRKKSHVDNSKCLESPEVMRKCKLNNVETSYKEKMKMKEMVADCDDINDNNVELFYESDIDDKSQNEVALVLQINTQANIEDQVKSSVQLKSPPFLEKIEDTESRSLMFEDTSSHATLLSSEPPSLKPEKKIETFKEKPDVSSSQPPGLKRSKRHFLDILENEGSCSDMLTKTSENYYDSGKKKKNTDVNENFGRHISDFISDQQAATNIELQNLFDKSEKGEVTLSEIKYLLKPPVELKRSISLATLLKVKLGLTKLLSDMEWPGKHNSSCMKKDSLSDFARRQQSDMFRKDYSTSFEESSDKETKVASSDGDENETCQSITSNIMQMLKNFESKGSISDIMSMLLNVLAESLGFSGKSSKTNIDVESEDYSEDSSYEDLPNVSPTKCALQDCMQKELLANFLEQGEQPPALDDISTAEDKDMNESILSHESTTDDFEIVYQVNEPAYVLSEVDNHSTLTKINREGDCGKIVAQSFYDAELAVEHTTGNATEKKIQTPESSKSDRMNDTSILKQDDHMQISDVVHKESQYSSESKVFKRITELNSIENSDDNSTDCDDYTVPFSLSKLSGKVDAWDINSDYYSDTDSDTEKFFEHQEMKTTLKFCGKIGVQSELKMQNSVTDFNKYQVRDQAGNASCKEILSSDIIQSFHANRQDLDKNQTEDNTSCKSDYQEKETSSEFNELSSDLYETVDETDCDSPLNADDISPGAEISSLNHTVGLNNDYKCGQSQHKELGINNKFAENIVTDIKLFDNTSDHLITNVPVNNNDNADTSDYLTSRTLPQYRVKNEIKMINASKFHIPNEIEDTKAIDIVKTIVCISVDKDVEISQHVADAYDDKKTNNTDNGQFISSASGDEICDKNIAKHMGIAYDDEDADDNDNAQDMICASDDDDDDKCDNLAKHRDIAYADKDTDDNDNAQDMAGAGDDDEKCDNNLPEYRVISYDVEDTDENYNAKHMVSAVDNKNTDDNHYVCHLGSAEDYKNVAGNDEVENTDNQDNAQQMAGAGYYDNNLAKHTNKAYDDEDTDDKDNTQHTGSDSDNENLDGKDKAQHMAGAGDDKDKYKNIALDDEDTNEYDNAEHIASAGDGENTDDNQPDYKMGSTYDCKGVDDVENTDDKYDAQNLAGAGDDEDMSDNNPAIHAVIANDDEVTDYHDNAEQVASAGDNKYTDDNHYFSNMGCSDHYKHTENKDYAEHNITVDGNEYPHNQDTTEDIVRTHENKHIEFKDNGKTTACDGTDDKDNVKNNAAGNGDIDDNNDTNNTASTYNFQNADEIEQKTLNVNGKQPHLHSNNSEFCDSATEELFSDCVEQPKCSTPIHSVSVTLYASDEASYKKIDQVEFSDAFGIIDTRCGQDSLDQPEDQPDITNTDAKNSDYCNGDERNNMFDHHREKILVEIGASSVEPNHREKQTSHFLKYMSKPVTRMLNVEVKHFHEENQPKILPLESTIRCTLMDDNDSLDSNCTVSYCEDQNNMVNAADFEHLLPFNTIESKERQDIDKEISDRKLSKVDRDVKLISINDSNFCKDKNVHYMIKESNSAYNTTASDSSDIASALSQRPTSSRNLATLDFNIEDYQPGGIFCESIAEKVKRKQRERALPVIYNPWLYDGCSNSSRKTIPKKEISVFRSAILEKRARERSESLDKAEGPASKKIKLSSKTEYAHEKKHSSTQFTQFFHIFNIRPCSVEIVRLSDRTIERYTRKSRKRKMDENLSDSRPPLKVRIKLNQVRYPIILHENFTKSPIFPEPSDNSDTDDDLKNSITVNAGFSCSSSKKSPMHSNTERQPIKIKMKTLLTKMNSCDKGEDFSLMDGEQKASFDDMKCKERADVHFYISDSESEPEPISHGNVIFETNSNSESSSSVNSDSEDEIQGTIENILDSRDGDKEQCDKHGNNHKSAQIQVPDEHLSDYDDDSGIENYCSGETYSRKTKEIRQHHDNAITLVRTSLDLSESESDDNMDLSNDISKQEPYYSVCSNQVSEAVENLKFDSFKKSEYSNTEEGGDIYYTAEIVQNDFELKDAVVYIESEKIIQEAIIEHEPELYGVAENQVVSTSFSDRVETVEDVIEIADEEVGVKETFATSRCGTGSDVSELVDDMPTSKYLYGISVDSPISQNMETLVSESSDVLSLECEVVYDEFTVT